MTPSALTVLPVKSGEETSDGLDGQDASRPLSVDGEQAPTQGRPHRSDPDLSAVREGDLSDRLPQQDDWETGVPSVQGPGELVGGLSCPMHCSESVIGQGCCGRGGGVVQCTSWLSVTSLIPIDPTVSLGWLSVTSLIPIDPTVSLGWLSVTSLIPIDPLCPSVGCQSLVSSLSTLLCPSVGCQSLVSSLSTLLCPSVGCQSLVSSYRPYCVPRLAVSH